MNHERTHSLTEGEMRALDGVSLESLAAAVGTPCYVYSSAAIRSRVAQISAAFADYPHTLHYALKANSTLAIARLLRSLGLAVDANSGGEIEVALRAGFIPPEIVFTGVGKTAAELELAVSLGVKAINAESRGELERIDTIARAQGTRARVALRVNPDVDAGGHPHVTTGLTRNKFGVPLDEAASLCLDMRTRDGLELVGLHVHVGSQIRSLDPIRKAGAIAADLAVSLRAQGVPLEHLDLGGGLGIAYDESPEPDIAEYARTLMNVSRPTGLALIVEPGRWIAGHGGLLLARVVDVKQGPDSRLFVIVDAGMTELLRPALYGAYHRIVPVTAGAGELVRCDIFGPVCESSDTLGTDRQLPAPRVGDVLAILDTGAYGAAMGSTYNRRPLPAEVLVEQGCWRVIRRRQTIEDMLALEE
jgi:diaminopimelate decarboxylase